MKIKWIDGSKELPIGSINTGDIRDMPDDIAKAYIKQKQAVLVREKTKDKGDK